MKIYVVTSVDASVYVGTYLSAGQIPTEIFVRCFDSIDISDKIGDVVKKAEFACHVVDLLSKKKS